MTRPLAAAVVLLALPAVSSAQYERQFPAGRYAVASVQYERQLPAGPYQVVVWQLAPNQVVVGPLFTDGVSTVSLVETLSPRFTVGGGSMSPQQSWYPTGIWGGTSHVVIPAPVFTPVFEERPVPPRPERPGDTRVALYSARPDGNPQRVAIQPDVSGKASATVVVQFPAAAEVWVGGKKIRDDAVAERPQTSPALIGAEVLVGVKQTDGSPPTELTLPSPTLKPGETHTFEVKGRWKSGGKTFEASRSVTVAAGDRTRLIVASGAEVQY